MSLSVNAQQLKRDALLNTLRSIINDFVRGARKIIESRRDVDDMLADTEKFFS